MDADDKETYLCQITRNSEEEKDGFWFREQDIPKDLLQKYKESRSLDENVTSSTKTACSTDKTRVYSCELKARTCGILILCGNCGIIEGFSELYGSESCTQVGAYLVDFYENFKGNITKNLLNSRI